MNGTRKKALGCSKSHGGGLWPWVGWDGQRMIQKLETRGMSKSWTGSGEGGCVQGGRNSMFKGPEAEASREYLKNTSKEAGCSFGAVALILGGSLNGVVGEEVVRSGAS